MRPTITTVLAATTAVLLVAAAPAMASKPRAAKHKPVPVPALTIQAATSTAAAYMLNTPFSATDTTRYVVDGCALTGTYTASCTYSGLRAVGGDLPYECWFGTGEWRCARPERPTETCAGTLTVDVLRWQRRAFVSSRSQPVCVATPEV